MNEQETQNELLPEGGQEGNIAVKRNKVADFIAKIGCLLLAFFLWYYAAAIDTNVSEEATFTVPIEIVNNSNNGFSVLSGDDYKIEVRVSGKRSVLRKLSAKDFTATVDISGVNKAGSDNWPIDLIAPAGVTVESTSSDRVHLKIDQNVAVKVPIKVTVSGLLQQGDYVIAEDKITTDVSEIEVYGPASLLVDKVECALLKVGVGQITQTVTYGGDLILTDKNGNPIQNESITLGTTYVTATIPVYRYRNVNVTVLFGTAGLSERYSVSVKPQSIRVYGEAAEVDKIKLEFTVTEKDLTADEPETTLRYSVQLPDSVENVTGIESVAITVEAKEATPPSPETTVPSPPETTPPSPSETTPPAPSETTAL